METTTSLSDQDLKAAVQTAMTAAVGADAQLVGVAAVAGEVTLTGDLSTQRVRQAAHNAAIAVDGVHAISDVLTVLGHPHR